MPKKITHKIKFKSQKSGETRAADMRVTAFFIHEQKMRALKTLLIFWSIGITCVLIPIAHIVLVPTFLIGGYIAAKRRWNTAEEAIDASGSCPACENDICIKLDKNADLPQWHDCPECKAPLELQATADHDASEDVNA